MAKQNTSNSTKAIVGGSYRQVRRGTRDFGTMTDNIKEAAEPGLTKLAEGKAFEKQLLKDYDTSKAKYEKSIDETIKGVGSISGSESISELKQKKAWNNNPNLQAKLRSELEVSAGQYAASTANKDAQGQDAIMKRNEGLTNTIGGVKAFVSAWSDPEVYHGEATNQTFENNEPGKPALSMDYVAEMNNTNPDSIGFEEGTTVGGIKKMMMTINDEGGNKRFIDMDAFNDPGTLTKSFKVRADLISDITAAQKKENYQPPVYDEIKRTDYNDDQSYAFAVSTKSINENTQNQYKDRTKAFSQNYVKSNQELLPSIYATMTASDWKPSSDAALPAGFTPENYSALTKASKYYGSVSDSFMNDYEKSTNAERIENNQEPLTKEQLNTKVQEAQDLMIQNYVEQQALADTPGYNLDENGNAALIGDLKAKNTTQQKLTVDDKNSNTFNESVLTNINAMVGTEVAGAGGFDLTRTTITADNFVGVMNQISKNNRRYVDLRNSNNIDEILGVAINAIETNSEGLYDDVEEKNIAITKLKEDFIRESKAKGGDSPVWYVDTKTNSLVPVVSFDGKIAGTITAMTNDTYIEPGNRSRYAEAAQKFATGQVKDISSFDSNMETVMVETGAPGFNSPKVPGKIDGTTVGGGNMNNASQVRPREKYVPNS